MSKESSSVLSDGFWVTVSETVISVFSIVIILLVDEFFSPVEVAIYGLITILQGFGRAFFRTGYIGIIRAELPKLIKNDLKGAKHLLFNAVLVLTALSIFFSFLVLLSIELLTNIYLDGNQLYADSFWFIPLIVFLTFLNDSLKNINRSLLKLKYSAFVALFSRALLLFGIIPILQGNFVNLLKIVSTVESLLMVLYFIPIIQVGFSYQFNFQNFRKGIQFYMVDILRFFEVQIDATLVGLFLSTEIFAEYFIIKQTLVFATKLIFSFNSANIPHLVATTSDKALQRKFNNNVNYLQVFSFLLFVGLTIPGIWVMHLVDFPFNSVKSFTIAYILYLSIFPYAISQSSIAATYALYKKNMLMTFHIIYATSNTLLLFILIILFEDIGAAIAYLLALWTLGLASVMMINSYTKLQHLWIQSLKLILLSSSTGLLAIIITVSYATSISLVSNIVLFTFTMGFSWKLIPKELQDILIERGTELFNKKSSVLT